MGTKEMTVITVASLKGGVGKSTTSILLANNLAKRGFKILVIDLDTNNSCTFYYTCGIENIQEIIETKNVFEALSHNNTDDNVIQSTVENVDIIPSHLNIDKLRSCSFNELKKTLENSSTEYDYVIIDTAPHYDNIIINALKVSDFIFTPLDYDSYNVTTTHHLELRFYDDVPEKIDNWWLIFSFWNKLGDINKGSVQSQYIELFENTYGNRTLNVFLPETKAVKKYSELRLPFSTTSSVTGIRNYAMAINKLVNMIQGYDADDESRYATKF